MSLKQTPIPASWHADIASFAAHLRVRGIAPTTIKTRVDWLRRFARSTPNGPRQVSARDVTRYASSHDWATETRRSVYASLRAFFRYLLEEGVIAEDPTKRLPRVKPKAPAPRPATDSALALALANCDKRTSLILRLAAYAGLRRAEIAQIHARDVIDDLLGMSLLVHGKGQKQRIVPLDTALAKELRAACQSGYAFPGDDHGHLSPRYVGKLATRALPGQYTLHTLRHRFATRVYANTGDLLAIQQLLGHSSPAITQRYIQMPTDRLRVAAATAKVA